MLANKLTINNHSNLSILLFALIILRTPCVFDSLIESKQIIAIFNSSFSDFYRNRTVNTRTDLNNARNNQLTVPPPPPSQQPTSYMDTTEETPSFNNLDKDDENMNEEYDEDETDENNNNNNKNGTNYKKRNSSDSGEENINETSSNK